MRKRTVVWSAKKAAPAIARAVPAVARAAAPAVARTVGTLLGPEVGLALAAGGALYSTVKGLAGMYHSTPSEYTKITAQGEETYHPSAQASVKPLGPPHKVSHRHPGPAPPTQLTPPTQTQPRLPSPSAAALPVAPSPSPTQSAPTAVKDPHRIDTATVGIKPFRIGSKPYSLAQWEANTHEIAEKMMSGHS